MNAELLTLFVSLGAPLLVVVALLLIVPAMLPVAARAHAAVTLLAALLLTTLAMLLSRGDGGLSAFTATDTTVLTMLLLAAGLAIAPLLDRARSASLVLVAPVAAFLITESLLRYVPTASAILPATLCMASLVALVGSALLAPHVLRLTLDGQLRSAALPQAVTLTGWALLAVLVCVLSQPSLASLLTALVAAFAALLTARAQDGLLKAGEALAAAMILAALVTPNITGCIALGLIAAFFVSRTEAIASSLRIDDPQHVIGTVLAPSMLGLLMPGIFDVAQLAPQLITLGNVLLAGLAIAAVLWPLTMLTSGLALPRQRLRALAR